MGEGIGEDLPPSGPDSAGSERAKVIELLSSEAWQKRLEEARLQREKVLAEKASRTGGCSAPDAGECGKVRPDAVPAPVSSPRRSSQGGDTPTGQAARSPDRDAELVPGRPSRTASVRGPLLTVANRIADRSSEAPRLKVALAQARAAERGGADRRHGRLRRAVLVLAAFALGLVFGIAAMQLVGMKDRRAVPAGAGPDPSRPMLATVLPTETGAPSLDAASGLPASSTPVLRRPGQLSVPALELPLAGEPPAGTA